MSLSDKERLEKIYFSIWRITRPERIQVIHAQFPELAEQLNKLWPAFLRRKGNRLYWILGSGTDREVQSVPSLFTLALCGNRDRGTPDWSESLFEDRKKEILKEPDPVKRQEALAALDLTEYQCNFHPTYTSILQRNAPALAAVYEVFEECEHILYAANRYQDEFSTEYSELTDEVARILGSCFDLFTTQTEFRAAWYIYQISNRIVYTRVNSDATIVKFWRQTCLHHDVGLGIHSVEKLHEYWVEIQQKQKLTTQEAVLATFWLLGRRFHYQHQFDNLVRLLKQHNRAFPKDRVNLDKVRQAFVQNQKAKKASDEHEQYTEDDCLLSGKTVRRDWTSAKLTKTKKKKKT